MRKIAGTGSTFADERDTPRSSLMLRVAKVVCQSGEYPCLLRDVSETGVGLRFFHKVPPEPRIILEQANGRTYPIERVWGRGHEAGYRLACEIDVAEFIAEPSAFPDRAIRLRIDRAAVVSVDGRECRARLIDLSCSGAKLAADSEWHAGAFVRLAIEGFPLRFGHVNWRKDLAHGVNFQGTMALDEFARHALALQPFRKPSGTPRVGAWAIRAA